MKNLMRAIDVAGLPVVAIDSGEDIAQIQNVIYDGSEHRLLGFTLVKRGFLSGTMKERLAAQNCTAIGADAVMVRTASDLTNEAEAATEIAPKNSAEVIGNRVMSADGQDLGEIAGVVIETDGVPSAVGYEVKRNDSKEHVFIPISEQMTISNENLLVPAEIEPFISNDLAGFGAAVATFRAGKLRGEQ